MHDAGDEEVAWPADAVEVARVAGAWGVQGGIRVQPYAADPQALFATKRWFLQPALAATRPSAGVPRLLRVKTVREQGGAIVATSDELADRTAAEALKGARIFVSRASFPTPAANEYYWVDLVGLAVVNRQGEHLGTVTDLLDTGAHSVLQVGGAADGVQRLVPFVAAYVDDVDLTARRITVDWQLDY